MRKVIILFIAILATTINNHATVFQPVKPRVIVMTDGEIDDRSSMVRFLLYTNEFDVEAIIQSNSVHQHFGRSSDKWLEKQLDAYEQVRPNLIVHDPEYPTAEFLRSKTYIGDEDTAHLVVDNDSYKRVPGMDPQIDPSDWVDTPGSERIVEVLLKDDPRPVYFTAWGGSNTLARALYKLKTVYPDQYDKAVSKVILYSIWYQDGAGSYIEKVHPKATILLSYYFYKTWAYGSQTFSFPFIHEVQNNYGPLGALYPQPYVSEGDSPSFLYLLQNGLRSLENPTFGGWGGRFYKVDGYENLYRDAGEGDYWRWIEYANRDFQSRLMWSITQKYKNANHYPVIKVIGNNDQTVHSGDIVTIETKISDNDSIQLSELVRFYPFLTDTEKEQTDEELAESVSGWLPVDIVWQQYKEAGTFNGMVQFDIFDKEKIQFIAPVVDKPETIHVIVQATDRGIPRLTAFERFIINILPK
ncbi:DUF1593 domain-containing protein [uncultured Draconibacterium sp.]|uniref:DUF1593 domain-containing protein n=1 Tax=uncultured Draconibacterium sp. TaxID=1573823 RepID=UPI0032164F2E